MNVPKDLGKPKIEETIFSQQRKCFHLWLAQIFGRFLGNHPLNYE